MGYVNISDYKEALTNPVCFFRTLKNIEAVRDSRGELQCTAGSNSVVFHVDIAGEEYAMKCYTSLDGRRDSAYGMIRESVTPEEGYMAGFDYMRDEILVYCDGAPTWYPVLLMEKVRGKTLGRWLGERCACRDVEALAAVARKFDAMALWLLDRPYAHGDLKHTTT